MVRLLRHASTITPALLIVACLALAVPIAQASASAASTSKSTASLPVVLCPTTYATPPGPEATPKTHFAVRRELEARVSLYTDTKRQMGPVLGPKGWRCQAEIAEDGGAALAIAPNDPAQFIAPADQSANTPLTKVSGGVIVAVSQGGCQGCVAAAACPYFKNAPQQLNQPSTSCKVTRPKGQVVKYISGTSTSSSGAVELKTPTGRDDEIQVIRYRDNPDGEGQEVQETCVLPRSQMNVCAAAVRQFSSTNWLFTPEPVATTKTTPTQSSSTQSTAAVTTLIEQSQSVPASEVTVQLDNDETTWAYWTVNNPNLGVAEGFAQLVGGTWEIAAGPGSADVGCSPGPTVPMQVLTYFGQSCSSSGNSGSTGVGNSGSGNSGNSGVTNTQTTISTSAAYQEGYSWGKLITGNPGANGAGMSEFEVSAACKKNFVGDLAATSAYYSGCMAGAGY